MINEPTECPICHCRALKSSVEGKLDVRVDCPRCKKFDIDYRAQVNLADLEPPPNAAILSGWSRHLYETERGRSVPRLVWVEVQGDNAGRYEFQKKAAPKMLASDKCNRLFQYIAEKVERTPGEVFTLHVPADLSLAFAKSENELDSYLAKLNSDGLISIERPSDNTRQVRLTVKGADHGLEQQDAPDHASRLPPANVKIIGEKKDSGLFGKVYPGLQEAIGRQVAIKIIQPSAKPNAIDHAKGLARISHPNVVSVFDVGTIVDPVSGGTVDCVVMEWLEGKKLSDVWTEIDPSELPSICKQIIDGLRAIHAAGICHRDLHPGNVMITGVKAKVIDVQYTESGHLSQLSTEPREDAIHQDVESMKWLVRNFILKASANLLTFELDEQIRNANTLEDICKALDHLQVGKQGEFSSIENIDSSNEAHELGRPAELLEELSALDREVLRVAGNLLVANADARFASRISVPRVFESLDHTSGIAESVRVLGELGYFHGTDHEHPRFIMMSKLGFRRYLEVFRPGYATDLQKLRVAIVRGGKASDLDLAIMTELPRPIVEHALIEFADEGLIQISSNNMHTRICDITTRIRRAATG